MASASLDDTIQEVARAVRGDEIMKGSSGKSPSIQWYYKDWLSDRKLQRAHPESRGIWMNLLMHMIDCSLDGEDCKEGVLEDVTIPELMQLGACDENAAWMFIEDGLKHQFCNIELDKMRTFHIMSRRLFRDAEKREYWRNTKRLQREQEALKDECPPDVQPSRAHPTPIPIPTPDIYTPKKVVKKKKIFTPPSKSDVVAFFKQNGFSVSSAKKAFYYYEDGDPPWTDSQGKAVRGWKQKMRGVWFKDENIDQSIEKPLIAES